MIPRLLSVFLFAAFAFQFPVAAQAQSLEHSNASQPPVEMPTASELENSLIEIAAKELESPISLVEDPSTVNFTTQNEPVEILVPQVPSYQIYVETYPAELLPAIQAQAVICTPVG